MADQLVPLPLVTPGNKGLNKAQAASTELDPGWSTDLQNAVIDTSGRIAARQGWSKLTVSAVGAGSAILSIGEYAPATGSTQIVSSSATKIYSGTTSMTDVTGAVTPPGGSYQWLNFNNLFFGVQAGAVPVQWNGTGNFANITVSTGTAPQGNCGVAAFGRLWILDSDNQTIKYCNLLDSTAWTGTGAGSVNMATIWTRGVDQVVAIAAAGSKLVVFGKNQIVIFVDSTGASIGLNPTNIIVYDTVEGTGCVARDSVQSTGQGDLTWLSPTGVQSLSRLLINKNNPVQQLDPQIREYVYQYFVTEDVTKIRSVYSPVQRFYLLLFPLAGRVFCYDTRTPNQDGSLRASEWTPITWTSCCNSRSGNIYFGESGVIGFYSGYTDNLNSYSFVWTSPWLSMAPNYENRVKVLKRIKEVVNFGGPVTVLYKWGFDFVGLTYSVQQSLSGTTSEYGIAQYNINEYGGGAGTSIVFVPAAGSGRWMQFNITSVVNGYAFSIQQVDAFSKIGNLI